MKCCSLACGIIGSAGFRKVEVVAKKPWIRKWSDKKKVYKTLSASNAQDCLVKRCHSTWLLSRTGPLISWIPLFSLLKMAEFKAQDPSRAVAQSLAPSQWRKYKSIPFFFIRIVSHQSVRDYSISDFLPAELWFSYTLFKRFCTTIVSLNYINLREPEQNCLWGMVLLSAVVLLPFPSLWL